jgi:DNA-binding CsgD family transcriptional regulator
VIGEAAAVQEGAALDEADAVAADAGLREAAAVEEADETEELAERLEAAATLSKAEKRVLHYLGTELTFAMIADKLKISRGAVKDRAGRLYKKLGVHSREEAVEAAVELGLLKA